MSKDITKLLPADSFFRRWIDCWPTAEPPHAYILFAAMSMLGAAIGRSCHFDQDVHTLFPMLNLLLIGPSGIGKSTSVGMGTRLVEGLPPELRPQIIKGKATKEKIHEDLVIQPHALIVASELANFFGKEKYNEGMIPYFTQLLDYEPEVQVRTKSGDIQTVREPEVTVIGGSTVEWLQEQLPSTATAGGFLPRFFIVKEDHKGKLVPNPKLMLSRKQRVKLDHARAEMQADFQAIVTEFSGEMDYEDYAAADAYAIWYQLQEPPTGNLAPFAARAGEHVLRLAMLLARSRHHTTIEKLDIDIAIQLHAYSMRKLQEVVVPYTPTGKLQAQILSIVAGDELSDVSIKRAMRNHCSAQDTEKLLQSLLQTGELAVTNGKYRRRS